MFTLTPAARLRLLYYFVFALFGVFHAEVLSRSQPWVLVNPFMFLLVVPVYACHYVVLGDLLLRRRATGFIPVFLAGCLLGMYEFVITKMYFQPTWAPWGGRVLEVSWLEVLYIGFFWHAFMSFAVPFFLVRKLVIERHADPLEIREVRWILFGAPLIAATFGVSFGFPLVELLGSLLVSLVALFLFAWFFRREAPALGYRGPDDLLLTSAGRKWAYAFLIGVYVFFGSTMRLEMWPSLAGLLIPALAYVALIAMFYPFVRAPKEGAPAPAPLVAFDPTPMPTHGLKRFFLLYAAAFVGFALQFQLLALVAPWILFILAFGILLAGGFGATALLFVAAKRSFAVWSVGRRPAAPG